MRALGHSPQPHATDWLPHRWSRVTGCPGLLYHEPFSPVKTSFLFQYRSHREPITQLIPGIGRVTKGTGLMALTQAAAQFPSTLLAAQPQGSPSHPSGPPGGRNGEREVSRPEPGTQGICRQPAPLPRMSHQGRPRDEAFYRVNSGIPTSPSSTTHKRWHHPREPPDGCVTA